MRSAPQLVRQHRKRAGAAPVDAATHCRAGRCSLGREEGDVELDRLREVGGPAGGGWRAVAAEEKGQAGEAGLDGKVGREGAGRRHEGAALQRQGEAGDRCHSRETCTRLLLLVVIVSELIAG